MAGMEQMRPEMMHGSPWHAEYLRIAPDPEGFAALFAKKTAMDKGIKDIPAERIRALAAPTLLIVGDSDIVQPEHAVELFRLLGGGVVGDMAGLARAQLAVLSGTTHVTLVAKSELLLAIVPPCLDAPPPAAD